MKISSENKEYLSSENGLALKVQDTFDQAFDINVFREPDTSSPALMATNELLKEDLVTQIRESSEYADGVIFSVGAGMTWVLPELFYKKEPKIILGFDFDPEVVFLGRIVVKLLKKASDFDEFLVQLESIDSFKTYGENVISEVNNQDLKVVFRDIDINLIRTALLKAVTISDVRRKIEITDVISSFKKNFMVLKTLAEKNKIAFVFADLLNTKTMDLFDAHLAEYKESNNIVYKSNVPEYLGSNKIKYLYAINGWHLSASSKSGYLVEAKLRNKKKTRFSAVQIYLWVTNFFLQK